MVPLCFALLLQTMPCQAQTSLSDITVTPVVPTECSTHCLQNELQADITIALHHPATLWSFSPPYSFCSNAFSYKLRYYVTNEFAFCQAFSLQIGRLPRANEGVSVIIIYCAGNVGSSSTDISAVSCGASGLASANTSSGSSGSFFSLL